MGVSGIAPYDLTGGRFDAAPAADAEGQADAEGPGGDVLVAIDGPSEDPESDADVEMTHTERLRKDGVSVRHLLAHSPKNPFCPTRDWAKALRKQRRRFNNEGLRVSGPCADPPSFGHLTTMGHWFAADEFSQWLRGETA